MNTVMERKNVEDAYMQTSSDNIEAALRTIMRQHLTVIDLLEQAEDQRCLDYDHYQAVQRELVKIGASLHTLVEERHGHTADETRAAF